VGGHRPSGAFSVVPDIEVTTLSALGMYVAFGIALVAVAISLSTATAQWLI